ncbi:hypothetical protein Tco_0735969 [Tanacetum coccineum]
MGTLDGRLLKSYRYKDLRALHFGILLCCEIFTFQVEQFKPMGFLIPPEHHIPLWPILGVLQIGIRAKVIENQGIPLVNAGELPEMDPYDEVAQQGQAHPLSPAYVPDPMELDEHVPVGDQPYADDASPTAESPGHIADSESMEEDSIDYPDEPEDDDEDPEKDLEEDHTNYPVDDEDEEPTENEEEEEHLAPTDPSAVPVVDPVPLAGDTETFETDESAPTPRSPQGPFFSDTSP